MKPHNRLYKRFLLLFLLTTRRSVVPIFFVFCIFKYLGTRIQQCNRVRLFTQVQLSGIPTADLSIFYLKKKKTFCYTNNLKVVQQRVFYRGQIRFNLILFTYQIYRRKKTKTNVCVVKLTCIFLYTIMFQEKSLNSELTRTGMAPNTLVTGTIEVKNTAWDMSC